MDYSNFELSEESLTRLKTKIILKENKNIKDHQMKDTQMVEWIKKQIEEEVQCCLSQSGL